MDVASLAAALVAARAGRMQMAVAGLMLKNSADSGKAALQLLEAGQSNAGQLGNLAAGVGQNLDITV